jgi:hypothetical protein
MYKSHGKFKYMSMYVIVLLSNSHVLYIPYNISMYDQVKIGLLYAKISCVRLLINVGSVVVIGIDIQYERSSSGCLAAHHDWIPVGRELQR